MKVIPVKLGKRSYKIYIEPGIFAKVPLEIQKLDLGNFGIVITSAKVKALYSSQIKKVFKKNDYRIVTVPDGEKAKSKSWLFKVIDSVFESDGLGRKVFIVCLGGGVVGDLGGFAAAIYKRGIPYVQVPTTLLAQIDSSIGGKTAIDLPGAKNILGAFYQPRAVFIDPNFLKTLSLQRIKEGLAEAIKYGIIKDKKLFSLLKNNSQTVLALKPDLILKIIYTCVKIKADIVSVDEKEIKSIRTILNFGHTFAHALEACGKYKKISHGQAVALGMIYAAQLSVLLKKCQPQTAVKVRDMIKAFAFRSRVNVNIPVLLRSLSYDKKFISGNIRMVLLKEIGKGEVINNIAVKSVKKNLGSFLKKGR